MLLLLILFIILSFFLLYFGAEFALNASEVMGRWLGLSPLLIGMLLIGFGTSLPEAFVSHIAAFEQQGEMAYGNLIGSNVANILLGLALTSLIIPLQLTSRSVRVQLVIHLFLALAVLIVFQGGRLYSFNILPLILILIIYMYFLFKEFKSEKDSVLALSFEEGDDRLIKNKKNIIKVFFKLNFGFVLLFFGGEILVINAIKLCHHLGVKEYVVSAIVIAFGTSFPEISTAIIAAFKRKDNDLILGNILGSNLFNCGLILSSLSIHKIEIKSLINTEIYAYVFGSLFLVILSLMKIKMYRKVSLIFLLSYGLVLLYWLEVINF